MTDLSSPSEGMDYKPRRTTRGGSKPGTVKIRCPYPLKLALYRWAIAEIGGGQEATFYRSLRPGGRFSAKAVAPVVPLLVDYLPEECAVYLAGDRMGRAAKLLDDRLHKMFYGSSPTSKGRGEGSSEHPRHWNPGDRAYAESRLAEVEWPW